MKTENYAKKFVIKRSEWHRGGKESLGTCQLLNEQGNKCCLGFYALACGLEENQIKDVFYYTSCKVEPFIKDVIPNELWKDANNRNMFPRVNDDKKISDKEREVKLTKMFADIGVEVLFED
jgi:hypothetical protein